MAAIVLDLNIEQGSTFLQNVVLSPVIDLTGFTGVCHIRAQASPNYPIVAKPVITVSATVPETGAFSIALSATDTAGIPCTSVGTGALMYNILTTYTYDVEMVKGSEVIRVVNGKVLVSPEVTRV